MSATLRGRNRVLRFRKNDPEHNLLAATQHWIRANGGEAVVIGGIEVDYEPVAPLNYKVAVRVLGRRPEPKAAAK